MSKNSYIQDAETQATMEFTSFWKSSADLHDIPKEVAHKWFVHGFICGMLEYATQVVSSFKDKRREKEK